MACCENPAAKLLGSILDYLHRVSLVRDISFEEQTKKKKNPWHALAHMLTLHIIKPSTYPLCATPRL